MNITLTSETGQTIFSGTLNQLLEERNDGFITLEEYRCATKVCSISTGHNYAPHTTIQERRNRVYRLIAVARIRGNEDDFNHWCACLTKIKRSNWTPNGIECEFASFHPDLLNNKAREAGCTEGEIITYWERAFDFAFSPEARRSGFAKIAPGSAIDNNLRYIVFKSGECYLNPGTFERAERIIEEAGTQITKWVIQSRKHDWIRDLLHYAYARNTNPLSLLRQLTDWNWKAQKSPGQVNVQYQFSLQKSDCNNYPDFSNFPSKSDRESHSLGGGSFTIPLPKP